MLIMFFLLTSRKISTVVYMIDLRNRMLVYKIMRKLGLQKLLYNLLYPFYSRKLHFDSETLAASLKRLGSYYPDKGGTSIKETEQPLREKVVGAQERRRAILKPRRKKSGIAFAVSSAALIGSLAATATFALKNFTVKGDSFMLPTIIAGAVSVVVFTVFGVFTNKFVNACRIYRANEKLSSTDDGARLEEIAEYKDLYEKFL